MRRSSGEGKTTRGIAIGLEETRSNEFKVSASRGVYTILNLRSILLVLSFVGLSLLHAPGSDFYGQQSLGIRETKSLTANKIVLCHNWQARLALESSMLPIHAPKWLEVFCRA